MSSSYDDVKISNLTKEIARSKAISRVHGPFQVACTACGKYYWPDRREDHLAVCGKRRAPFAAKANPVQKGYIHVLTPERRRKKRFPNSRQSQARPKPHPPKVQRVTPKSFRSQGTPRPKYPPAVVVSSKPSSFERLQAKWADDERRLASMITEIVQAAKDETASEGDPVQRRKQCVAIAQQRIAALPNPFKRNALLHCERLKWSCFNF